MECERDEIDSGGENENENETVSKREDLAVKADGYFREGWC